MHEHYYSHASGTTLSFYVAVVLLGLLLTAYLGAAHALFQKGHSWQKGRSLSFICGVGLLVAALSPYLMHFAH